MSYLNHFPIIRRLFGQVILEDLKESTPHHALSYQIKTKNTRYLAGVDLLLRELEPIHGFEEIIRDMRNPTEFYDNLSTLQFCELLRESKCSVEEIFGSRGKNSTPDIRFQAAGKTAYAECKHIIDPSELMSRVIEHFRTVKSSFDLAVFSSQGVPFKSSVEKAIVEIEQRITEKQTKREFTKDEFEIYGLRCKLIPKGNMISGATTAAVGASYPNVGPELFRQKITQLLTDAELQLKGFPSNMSYVFINSDLVTLTPDEISALLYGTTETWYEKDDLRKCSQWNRFEKALRADKLGLLIEKRMIPSCTKNRLDGLYLNQTFDNLNSVLFVDFLKKINEYPNPFVDHGEAGTRLPLDSLPFPLSSNWLDVRLQKA